MGGFGDEQFFRTLSDTSAPVETSAELRTSASNGRAFDSWLPELDSDRMSPGPGLSGSKF